MALLTSFLCNLLLASAGVALGNTDNELIINEASDFITFSKDVNSGANYSGTTIYLESDLDFSGDLSEQFEPIGKDLNSPFSGIFDGQGNTISNLAVKSSSLFVGLFGYTTGTIKSVVMDSSCSVTCNFTGSDSVRVGGIIGYHNPSNKNSISNIVNMAGVTFERNDDKQSTHLSLGGIVGHVSLSSIYETTVRNCINYGKNKCQPFLY